MLTGASEGLISLKDDVAFTFLRLFPEREDVLDDDLEDEPSCRLFRRCLFL
jgi:hypothetical protein